ncbi:MAG: arsenic resistance N-acetyltransferase ArsN2 [Woeseiaceae bacterium]
MQSTTINAAIRAATPDDLPSARALLKEAALPTEDLSPEHLAFVAQGVAGMLGVIGVESYGDVALLRSLVVSPAARTRGLGGELVAALELSATNQGTRQLWLLTTDASDYFFRRGFTVRSRDEAPEPIRNSAEFSSLCPGDAVLMSKKL